MHTSHPSFHNKVLKWIHFTEDALLVSLLLLMIGMAVTQIFLRNIFDTGIIWGDVLVRILVLWTGLIGAMVASRNGEHIRIDLVTRWLPKQYLGGVDKAVSLATAVICGGVVYYSIRFVRSEMAYGGEAFAGIPAWVCEAVIPFAFAVMSIRFLALAFKSRKSS